MGSSYSGEPNMGNERPASSSSRKGKKNSSNSEKQPKQPQRGLGVAQLEKIRLHSQMGGSFPPTYPPNPSQEDMRQQTAYSSVPASSSFSYTSPSSPSFYGFHGHQNIMMGMADQLERSHITYPDSQAGSKVRWNPSNGMQQTPYLAQPTMTVHFPFYPQSIEQDSLPKKRRKDRSGSAGSSSDQNSETSDTQEEVDLELRL